MPTVSVVMGVYNAVQTVDQTVASILGQNGCDFELIVIDDGSTDGTSERLARAQISDSRLRVERQPNLGLTEALHRGCALATGEFIARQDAGDTSRQGRLAKQLAFLHDNPNVVMTACAAQFVGPGGEAVYEVTKPMWELDAGLRASTPERLSGPPHHGATMFRRSAYEQVGGYRQPFVVAQDLDLWLRLAEVGPCLGTDDMHYVATLALGSISSRRREEQVRLTQLAFACRQARKTAGDDAALLVDAVRLPVSRGQLTRKERARFEYFLASCLRRRDPAAARTYYRAALRDNPLHLKAMVRWLAG